MCDFGTAQNNAGTLLAAGDYISYSFRMEGNMIVLTVFVLVDTRTRLCHKEGHADQPPPPLKNDPIKK